LLLVFNALVSKEYFLGDLPASIRGFKDEQTGGVTTKGFTTDFIKPFEIEQGMKKEWRKIDNPEELSIKPVLRMAYSDVMPVGELQ